MKAKGLMTARWCRSYVVHGASWLIFPIGMVVLHLAQITVLVLIFLIGLLVDVRRILLDIFYTLSALRQPVLSPCLPLTFTS